MKSYFPIVGLFANKLKVVAWFVPCEIYEPNFIRINWDFSGAREAISETRE